MRNKNPENEKININIKMLRKDVMWDFTADISLLHTLINFIISKR